MSWKYFFMMWLGSVADWFVQVPKIRFCGFLFFVLAALLLVRFRILDALGAILTGFVILAFSEVRNSDDIP